jgi:tetratricopeptide (TPR) repeat protein
MDVFFRFIREGLAILLAGGLLGLTWYSELRSVARDSETLTPSEALSLVSAATNDSSLIAPTQSALNNLLESDPSDARTLFGLGWVAQLAGNERDALEWYGRAASEIGELQKFIHYNRSFISSARNEALNPIEELEAALRIDPRFALAEQRLRMLREAPRE